MQILDMEITNRDEYISVLEVCVGFLDGDFEADYFKNQGRNPVVLYQRSAMTIQEGVFKAFTYQWRSIPGGIFDLQYTEDLAWLKNQPLVDGIDGVKNGTQNGNIMDDLAESGGVIPWTE